MDGVHCQKSDLQLTKFAKATRLPPVALTSQFWSTGQVARTPRGRLIRMVREMGRAAR
jgi:hypothetical protein